MKNRKMFILEQEMIIQMEIDVVEWTYQLEGR